MSAEERAPCCDLSGSEMSICEANAECCAVEDAGLCPTPRQSECSPNLIMEEIPTSFESPADEDSGLRQRLRTTVEQLVADLSGNPTLLHPIFTPPPLVVQDLEKIPRISYHEVYMMSVMYFLQFINIMTRFFGSSWSVCKNVYKGVKKSLSENVYVFFEGSSYPYPLDEIDLRSPGVPSVEWYYNHTTHTFVSARLYNNSQTYQTHHVPYLSTEIQYNDLTLYDVTEFMNDVRWAGEEGEPMPNADHLVSAWTLYSSVVVKRSDAVSLRVINTDGDEQRVPLRNQA